MIVPRLERVAVDGDEVGQRVLGDEAELVAAIQHLGVDAGRLEKHFVGRADAAADLELAALVALLLPSRSAPKPIFTPSRFSGASAS